MILTLDLGTTTTKATLWEDRRPIATARHALASTHPAPGLAEQDCSDWWDALGATLGDLGRTGGLDGVEAVGFAAARETFVAVGKDGRALGPAILWSDRRAAVEAADIARRHGGKDAFHQLTGVVSDAGNMAAKVAWLAAHRPERLAEARWLLSPRDLMVWRLTGEVVTDTTVASRTGLYDTAGTPLDFALELAGERLAPVVSSSSVVGAIRRAAADELGLPAGAAVVVGAGDRACEVLGSSASRSEPMVSWGTTTNVSVPVGEPPSAIPPGISLSGGALGGHLLEAGTSSSGQAIGWLASLTGRDASDLAVAASAVPPGAGGLVALPWLNGARAPWWEPDARGAFVGISASTTSAEMARALFEAVAVEVTRCLEAVAPPAGVEAVRVVGTGAGLGPWIDILAAACDRPVLLPRVSEAASVGALVLTASALGSPLDPSQVNPIGSERSPDRSHVAAYAQLRSASDRIAEEVVALAHQLSSPTMPNTAGPGTGGERWRSG